MKKSFLIARANIRRAKGQTAAIVVLILLASMMMNLWLMLAVDYKRNFERYHDRLNAEHVTLAVASRDAGLRDFISETVGKDERTAEYCMDDALFMVGSFAYNGGEVNTEFVILDKETALNRSVGKIEIVEDSAFTSGIYMPLLYGTDRSIAEGDTLDITIGSRVVSYRVCGLLNSVMTGSHNCSMSALVLTEDQYQELEEKEIAPRSTLVSVRLHDKDESEDFEAALKEAVSAKYPDVRMVSNNYEGVYSSRYISQMICSGTVSAMAFFVTLISLVVIASNVMNYIQENMKNLGALKAAGYTSSQLIGSLLLQFSGITLLTIVGGAALSYGIFPAINRMMISQTGIPYAIRFLPVPLVAAAALIEGTVALTVWLSAHRIKKIAPIVALRQGVQTHNFKRNHVPLCRTKAPLALALALKTTMSGIKQNVTVCITMLVLSLVVVFSGLMTENVIVNMEPFVDLIVGEIADSCISVTQECEEEFLELLRGDDRVEKVYLYNSIEVLHAGGSALTATLTDDFGEVNNQNVVFDGRFPKYDNEMAVAAKYAKEHGLRIGDEITLTAEGRKADYIISGFTQISNNLGKDCLMTRGGYERMGSLQNVNYYINLAEETDIDGFHRDVCGELGDRVNVTINIASVMDGTATVYISLMTVIVIAILLLSGVVITFVLYLLVRTMLNNKKRDYGILKALGFTTRQLILQTALSFMPAVILSAVVGIAVSACVINPLTALFLNGIGIVKCTFHVPVGFITAAGAGLILFAFGIACLLSLRIKKIAPRTLLAGE